MRDEGVPSPGHAKASVFRQINPHLRCGPAPLREEKQRLQINLSCSNSAEPLKHTVNCKQGSIPRRPHVRVRSPSR